MKIRIEGTPFQTSYLAAKLSDKLSDEYEITSVSKYYPNNKGNLKEGRIYIDLKMV